MDSIKIAFIVPYFSGFGSNESEIVTELIRKGHKVTIFTTNVKSGSRLKDIKFTQTNNFNIVYVRVLFNFPGWVYTVNFSKQLKDFDLIMAQEDYQYTSYIGYLAAKKYNIELLVSNERYYHPSFLKDVFLRIIEFIYTNKLRKYVSLITTHAHSSKKYLRAIGFNKKIPVIYTALNLNNFKIIKSNIIQNKYNLSKKDIIVLSIGRLVPFKNYLNLIKVFSRLPINYKLIIIGNGVLKLKLRNYLLNNNVKNVYLETNFIKPNIIRKYINSADVYIQPSIIEPFGIAVREAMALGKPIIVTKEGGLIEAVNKNGYFISKDLNHLKNKIDLCYKHKIQFSKNSLKLVQQYNVIKICDKYLKLIKKHKKDNL